MQHTHTHTHTHTQNKLDNVASNIATWWEAQPRRRCQFLLSGNAVFKLKLQLPWLRL